MDKRWFGIETDYYNEGETLFRKRRIGLKKGITVLVGCNGSGKSTLIRHIETKLTEKGITVMLYDNLTDGGDRARSKAGLFGDFEFLATSVLSSEGENIVLNMEKFTEKMGAFIKENASAEEMWFLFDATDSGLSIDNTDSIMSFFDFLIDHNADKDVYVVVTANGYEMARKRRCFDVTNGEYVKFEDYEEYREFILNSRKNKDKRFKEAKGNGTGDSDV